MRRSNSKKRRIGQWFGVSGAKTTKRPRYVRILSFAVFVFAVAYSPVAVSFPPSFSTAGTVEDLQTAGATAPAPRDDGLRGIWSDVSPSFAPARYESSLAYVPALHGSLLFGGSFQSNETWRYRSDANNWSPLSPPSAPPPAVGGSMAYDSRAGKVVFFGGLVRPEHLICPGNDTWIYDPLTNIWTNVTPTPSPPPRWQASIAYDSATHRTVLFGGHRLRCGGGIPEDPGPRLNDTWTYDALTNTWSDVTSSVNPPARSEAGFASDPKESRSVLFGGVSFESYDARYSVLGDTWVFDPGTASWWHHDPVVRPPGRHGQGMASMPNVTILYGGCYATGCYRDTWSYDMRTHLWAEVPSNPGPTFAPQAAFAYDPDGVIVAYGNLETWEFRLAPSGQGPPDERPPTDDVPTGVAPSLLGLPPYALATAAAVGGVLVAAWWWAKSRRPGGPRT